MEKGGSVNGETISVVGSGSWGTVIAKILAENGHPVLMWVRREELREQINCEHVNGRYLDGIGLPENLTATGDLQHICETTKFIILVVPSHGFRAVAAEMGPYLTGEHVIVHATKGIEQDSYKRMSELLIEETPVRKIGVLSGPNLARELAQKQPAGTLVASRFHEVQRRAQAALHNSYFRVYGGSDVIGAEIGGTFKNIVALAAGVVDGLGMGDNTKALLLTRGLNEMAQFGALMGAEVITFGGMAGFGDMIATCASPLSRNHQVGERLAKGQSLEQILSEMKMVAEGVKATKAVRQFAEKRKLPLHIVRAVHGLLYENATVDDALSGLMDVGTGDEFSGFRL